MHISEDIKRLEDVGKGLGQLEREAVRRDVANPHSYESHFILT